MKLYRVDPALLKTHTWEEVKQMYEVLPYDEIDDILSSGRVRGYWEDVVKNFANEVAEAEAEGHAKFGIVVDLNGKSVQSVRQGLVKACEKLNKDFRVIAKADKEQVFLLWMAQ